MNESTVIILFVAANPSKDISRAGKNILRKKEEMESVELRFHLKSASIGINITHSFRDGTAVSLQLIAVGKRHCRVPTSCMSAAENRFLNIDRHQTQTPVGIWVSV